jgi:hypothetical protein
MLRTFSQVFHRFSHSTPADLFPQLFHCFPSGIAQVFRQDFHRHKKPWMVSLGAGKPKLSSLE